MPCLGSVMRRYQTPILSFSLLFSSFSPSLFSLLFSITIKIPAKLLYASQIPDQNLLFHFYNVLRIDATPHCFHSEGSDLMRDAVRCRPETEQSHSMRA